MIHHDSRFHYPECGPNARRGEDWVFMDSVYGSLAVAALKGAW